MTFMERYSEKLSLLMLGIRVGCDASWSPANRKYLTVFYCVTTLALLGIFSNAMVRAGSPLTIVSVIGLGVAFSYVSIDLMADYPRKALSVPPQLAFLVFLLLVVAILFAEGKHESFLRSTAVLCLWAANVTALGISRLTNHL